MACDAAANDESLTTAQVHNWAAFQPTSLKRKMRIWRFLYFLLNDARLSGVCSLSLSFFLSSPPSFPSCLLSFSWLRWCRAIGHVPAELPTTTIPKLLFFSSLLCLCMWSHSRFRLCSVDYQTLLQPTRVAKVRKKYQESAATVVVVLPRECFAPVSVGVRSNAILIKSQKKVRPRQI